MSDYGPTAVVEKKTAPSRSRFCYMEELLGGAFGVELAAAALALPAFHGHCEMDGVAVQGSFVVLFKLIAIELAHNCEREVIAVDFPVRNFRVAVAAADSSCKRIAVGFQ